MAEILKGAPAAANLDLRSMEKISLLKEKGIVPTIAIVRLGERSDDIWYENSVARKCQKIGCHIQRRSFPDSISEDVLLEEIESLNHNEKIHGVLIMLPLPKHINAERVRQKLVPEKDVDGITDISMAGVMKGNGRGYAPCTAQACMELLHYYSVDLTGKNVVMVGRSLVVGKPLSMLLLASNATVTVCHTKTKDVRAATRQADIVIAAAGVSEFMDDTYFSHGQVIIDVGVNENADGKICGDVKFEKAESSAAAISPVPGGVGSITTSVVLSHTVDSAYKSAGL